MPSFGAWMGLSGLVVAVDQLTKFAMTQWLERGQSVRVTPFFELVLVYNPGAAFSFLSDAAGWQRWFFVLLALGISVWLVRLIRLHTRERWLALSFALILGGALGNVIDRLFHGAVIDFLYFHAGRYGWPAFNVADSAISVGVALLLWDQLFAQRRREATG